MNRGRTIISQKGIFRSYAVQNIVDVSDLPCNQSNEAAGDTVRAQCTLPAIHRDAGYAIVRVLPSWRLLRALIVVLDGEKAVCRRVLPSFLASGILFWCFLSIHVSTPRKRPQGSDTFRTYLVLCFISSEPRTFSHVRFTSRRYTDGMLGDRHGFGTGTDRHRTATGGSGRGHGRRAPRCVRVTCRQLEGLAEFGLGAARFTLALGRT